MASKLAGYTGAPVPQRGCKNELPALREEDHPGASPRIAAITFFRSPQTAARISGVY